MIQIYTGDGKGKTTCSIGLSIRAAAAGLKVCFIQFDKGGDESTPYSERKTLSNMENLDFKPTGKNRRNKDGTFRFKNIPEDFEEAKKGLALANEALTSDKYDVLILDEVLSSILTGLLLHDDILLLVETAKTFEKVELIMTGRGATLELIDKADLVTEMKKVKHYFDKKQPARLGIEF